MDVGAGGSSRNGGDTYRRIRRDSYSAAMINETEIEDVKSEEMTATKSQQPTPRRKQSKSPDDNLDQCETWSVESCAFAKRDLTRTSSIDTTRSWNESVEVPVEIFLSHPELWTRFGPNKCFPTAKPSDGWQWLCQCRCSQCHYHRRKISTCSSRDHAFLGYKRKDSGHSVSTCQSILPPSSGRNSVASLLHEIKEDLAGPRRGTMDEEEEVTRRRHSDQTQCGSKIGCVDSRRFSEQTLARVVEGVVGRGREESRAFKTRSPPEDGERSRRASERGWCESSLENGEPLTERLMEGKVVEKGERRREKRRRERKEESSRESSTERRRSSVNITPKMMRRRFSEQLILEGGLGSVQDYEDLVEGGGEGAEEESFTAANARKRITLRRHYYPEGGWGRAIVSAAILVQLICHGVQLGSGVLLDPMAERFPRDASHTGRNQVEAMEIL